MRQSIVLLAALVAGCNQADDNPAANSSNIAAAEKPKPKYCFFKDNETKGWSASRDKDGNIVVKGKAHLDDNRYMGTLVQPEVSGASANLWLTMGPNTNATGAPENWWDVTATVPNSAAVPSVTVMCGRKTVAQLPVKPKA